MINKLLAYFLNCSPNLSSLDPHAERGVAMATYMWLILIPSLALCSIPAIKEWIGLSEVVSLMIIICICSGLIVAIREFIIYCFTSKQTSANLIAKSLPCAFIIAIIISSIPTLYFIGGVTDRWTLELWFSDWSMIMLTTFIISLIVSLNIAAVLAIVISTAFIRSIGLTSFPNDNTF